MTGNATAVPRLCKVRGMAKCGTLAGRQAHYDRKEKPCDECRQAYAEYRKGRRTPRPRPKPDLQPCGTRAAYKRHLARKEEPCDLCREANRAFWREYNQKRRQAA